MTNNIADINIKFENFSLCYKKEYNLTCLYEGDVCISQQKVETKLTKTKFSIEDVLEFIKPTINIDPYKISEDFTDKENPFHWQQPCCTEMKAFELHSNISLGTNFNKQTRTIDTYLGLPWASFIDKKFYVGEIVLELGKKISAYKRLAKWIGYTLNVHTVCQSIHWKRCLDHFYHIGVTDLHASHYSEVLTKKENYLGIKLHAWHLYAVNVEDYQRNTNIVINNFDCPNALLASFKGAYMPHYLSEIRLLLDDALTRDKIKTDIVLDVNDEWHFNKEVFVKQVNGTDISTFHDQTKNDIYVYNDLLCRSTFSLCPEGAGINTIRFWEALAVGSIPVLMVSAPHVPMLFRLHPNLHKCCIVLHKDKTLDVFRYLRTISDVVIREKRHLCRTTYLEIKNQTAFVNQKNTLFDIY